MNFREKIGFGLAAIPVLFMFVGIPMIIGFDLILVLEPWIPYDEWFWITVLPCGMMTLAGAAIVMLAPSYVNRQRGIE